MARKKQVIPSLVDMSSSAERLSKLIVTDDRGSPVSSYLALARTSAMATAPATAKATLDDSAKRAYIKIGETHRNFKRRFVSCRRRHFLSCWCDRVSPQVCQLSMSSVLPTFLFSDVGEKQLDSEKHLDRVSHRIVRSI